MHDLLPHNIFTSLASIFLDMANRSFKQFVEQELGVVPKFFIYALLEWVMIAMLLFDGFVAFLANEFANFFELPAPCLLCTRIDRVLLCRNSDFCYKDSVCEHHKKKFSSLAFCHVHDKLSEVTNMCGRCLLSFATDKESDSDRYKSLLAILHKGVDLFVGEDHELHLSFPGRKENQGNDQLCSCCGETLKVKSSAFDMKSKNKSSISTLASVPSPSPTLTLTLTPSPPSGQSMLMDGDDEDWKNPHFTKGNKFFGIPLSDSTDSPIWTRSRKPLFLDRTESGFECREVQMANDATEGDILYNLKRQLRLDRKSLMALYVELDEERSASAIAANNAMAMITRLQAEKASVQMEALQYQRMMEEQAQYDQEALEAMCDLVVKREEEIKDLMEKLEECKRNYEYLMEAGAERMGNEDQCLKVAEIERIADDLCLNESSVEQKEDNQSDFVERNGDDDQFLKEVNVERNGDDEIDEKDQVLTPAYVSSSNGEAQSFSSFDEEPQTAENADNNHPSDSMHDNVQVEEAIDKSHRASHDHPSDSVPDHDKVEEEAIRKDSHDQSDSFPEKVQGEAIDKLKKPFQHPSSSVPDKFQGDKLIKRTSQHISGSVPDKVQGEAIDKLIRRTSHHLTSNSVPEKVQGGAIDKLIRRTSQHLSGSVPDKVHGETNNKLKRTSMHLSDSIPDKTQGEAIDKPRRKSHHRAGSVPDKVQEEAADKSKKALAIRQLGRLKNLR